MRKVSRFLNTKIIIIILVAAMIVSASFSVSAIHNLQGNARVINYTGVVRGATQRLVKEELLHSPDDALIERLDSILGELESGNGKNGLIRLESREYQDLLGQMQIEWERIKEAILAYRDGASAETLYSLSESYFDLADQTVSAAEKYTEKTVQKAKLVLILVNFIFVIIAVMCAFIVHVQRRREDTLKAKETETQAERAHLEQLSRDIRAPLDQLSELMYVSDLETYDLLFVNSAGRETFHITDLEGRKCYKTLQGLDAPCPFCSTPELKPDENHTWEYTNPLTKRHYLLKDRLVEWDGRPARFEIAFDMTEEEKEKQTLKNLLDSEKVLVECIQELYQNHNLSEATSFVLKHIGEFLRADRAYIFDIQNTIYAINTYEWCAEGIRAEIDNLNHVPLDPFKRWIEAFKKEGYLVIEDVASLKGVSEGEYELLTSQNIQNLVTVPLERDGELYAFIGVDNPSPVMKDNAIPLMQALRYFLMLAIKRAENEETMNQLSFYDTLTSFYNRNRYMQDLSKFAQAEEPLGIVYLDLNGLKDVNDRYGHAAGDRMLVECARYIRECFCGSNLYRIGGDEFIIIYTNGSKDAFQRQVRDLRTLFNESSDCQAAIGSHWAAKGMNIDAAVAAADQKMYSDKQAFYRENHASRRYRHGVDDIVRQTALKTLRGEIGLGRFVVYLQPKVSIDSREIIGCEALVRYRRESGELIAPETLIPLLEANSIISEVDFYVFEFACSKHQEWRSKGWHVLPISVNFSRLTLTEPHFTENLLALCQKYHVQPLDFEIEVTQSVNGGDYRGIKEVLDHLRNSGFLVSIDDFGTKSANFALFSAADFDELKIDHSLILDIADNHKAKAIIDAMVTVCNENNIKLVAEGVEDEAQLEILKECGVKVVQGYLFSHPLPVDEYEARFLEKE